MRIHIRTSADGDWIAVYKDGRMVEQNHSCDIRQGLEALGISFTDEEMVLDDIGNLPDGADPFPERL